MHNIASDFAEGADDMVMANHTCDSRDCDFSWLGNSIQQLRWVILKDHRFVACWTFSDLTVSAKYLFLIGNR